MVVAEAAAAAVLGSLARSRPPLPSADHDNTVSLDTDAWRIQGASGGPCEDTPHAHTHTHAHTHGLVSMSAKLLQ